MTEPDSGLTIEEQNAVAAEERRARIRDRAHAFQQVFGCWEEPSGPGAVMIAALLAKFGNPPGEHGLPPNVLDKAERTDPYQTWRRLGHFDVLEYIRAQLEWKEQQRGK